MPLAQLSPYFQSLPLLTTSKLGPSGADSHVGGFVYVLGLHGSFQQRLGVSPNCHDPHRFLQPEVLRLYFPMLKPCFVRSVSLPSYFFRFVTHKCGTAGSTSHRLATSPLHPGYLSLPLLPVWMTISSVAPWLLDSNIVWFSGGPGCFFLFFHWLCEEAKCVYLHLHFGWKYNTLSFTCKAFSC